MKRDILLQDLSLSRTVDENAKAARLAKVKSDSGDKSNYLHTGFLLSKENPMAQKKQVTLDRLAKKYLRQKTNEAFSLVEVKADDIVVEWTMEKVAFRAKTQALKIVVVVLWIISLVCTFSIGITFQ